MCGSLTLTHEALFLIPFLFNCPRCIVVLHPAKLSFAEMVDFLKLKRFGSLVDSEMNQQVFILDLSFNPEITDELMVIYFDLNKEIFCITHES